MNIRVYPTKGTVAYGVCIWCVAYMPHGVVWHMVYSYGGYEYVCVFGCVHMCLWMNACDTSVWQLFCCIDF